MLSLVFTSATSATRLFQLSFRDIALVASGNVMRLPGFRLASLRLWMHVMRHSNATFPRPMVPVAGLAEHGKVLVGLPDRI